jgi:hypothetical protein
MLYLIASDVNLTLPAFQDFTEVGAVGGLPKRLKGALEGCLVQEAHLLIIEGMSAERYSQLSRPCG